MSMLRWFFLALQILHSGVAAQLSGCTSDVVRYMEKMQASFMSAAAEAANYLPIGRCDCILDDNTKETPLHRVVNLASHGGVAPGPLSVVVEALLAKHGDLSAQDQSGATPLHLAAFHGQATAMSVLAWAASRSSNGALIFGIKDAEGLTPLAKALKVWKIPSARILALSGAPAANATLIVECRPDLVAAVLQTELQALSRAVAEAPAPKAAGNCLVPPNSGRNSTLLHLAAELSSEDSGPQIIRELLDAGAKVDRADTNGDTALNSALREDSSEVVSMMLSADGGSALLSQTNRQGQSALHIAATAGASNSLRLLVAEGADTTAKDAHGKTALQYAEQRGDVEAVESISLGSTLKVAEDSGGKAQNFKSSASWTAQDEAAVEELEEGLSTELIAAVIVAVAGGGLCLVLLVCMLRRRFGRRKRSMVAQEAKPERRKQVWTEQTEALRKNRTLNNADRRESNEVHQLQGSALKAAVVVQTPATPTQGRSAGEVSQLAFQAEASKARSDPAKKGKLSQGPRQAAKADSPASVPTTTQDHRPQRKAKAKSRSAKQPK